MSNSFLFRATNHHSSGCGTPPCLDEPLEDTNVFRSYFENQHGEQWILTHDIKTDAITIYSGDCGWETELTIKSLKASLAELPKEYADRFLESANTLGSLQSPVVCGKSGAIFLGEAEQLWTAACLNVIESRRAAATAGAPKR